MAMVVDFFSYPLSGPSPLSVQFYSSVTEDTPYTGGIDDFLYADDTGINIYTLSHTEFGITEI